MKHRLKTLVIPFGTHQWDPEFDQGFNRHFTISILILDQILSDDFKKKKIGALTLLFLKVFLNNPQVIIYNLLIMLVYTQTNNQMFACSLKAPMWKLSAMMLSAIAVPRTRSTLTRSPWDSPSIVLSSKVLSRSSQQKTHASSMSKSNSWVKSKIYKKRLYWSSIKYSHNYGTAIYNYKPVLKSVTNK